LTNLLEHILKESINRFEIRFIGAIAEVQMINMKTHLNKVHKQKSYSHMIGTENEEELLIQSLKTFSILDQVNIKCQK
jgi:hypothetical protein